MTADHSATDRVRKALDHLRPGLSPFVEAWMKKKHGADWGRVASRAHGSDSSGPLDAYGLLKTILDNWRFTFEEAFQQRERHRVRNFVSTSLEARNATSHLTLPLQDTEALRYLDAIHELLRVVKAPETETSAIKGLYEAQRRSGLADKVTEKPPAEPRGTLSLPLTPREEGKPDKALRPWIEVALPHADVLENRFRQSEFAADLFAVDSGNAAGEYADPRDFFRITFLTEGLKRVLSTALQRLGGTGGDPVIGLQTAFGGGKTHTMLAAYHLCGVDDPAPLEGLADLAVDSADWKRPKTAVFVGTSKATDDSLVLHGGPKVRTLWGYIAWRLAGDAGLELVKEAEAARTNPGSELMVEVFKLAGPSLILLDELVAYARQLPDDRFEAFLSFIQSLTEAAKMVPDVLVIGSLPESDAEVGGEKGKAALLRLERVFGRVQSPWLPATGDETYEIIRRRLFQPLDSDGERAREETCKAFHKLYRDNAAEFPPEARETRYLELLRLSYPIHPELFDRLSKDWASLEKFQRTRGVLQFMANVIGVLWQERSGDPLITPARVPVSHEKVRASILYPLDPAFGAVVDKEVDGPSSLPAQKEANPQRRISQARAATRTARSVFLCSAPLVGQPNAGVTGPGVRLACAEPGDQLAIFGEALRELSEQATYLYEEAGRYWFSTQPTLNRLADERGRSLPEHEVDEYVRKNLREDGGHKAGFAKVHAVPDDASTVDEAEALALVILSPATAHSGRSAGQSAATEAVSDALLRCRNSQRRHRNTLIFVAADEAQLATARDVVRKAIAWQSIADDKRLQGQLTQAQAADARDKASTNKESASKAIRNAWSHILYPVETVSPGKPFDLEHASIGGGDKLSVPISTFTKVVADGIAREKLGADTLWLKLKDLWPEDRDHLPIAEIAGWFASYVHLPRIKNRTVLDLAIRDAVAKFDASFGYADAVEGSTYTGLRISKGLPEFIPDTAVLVREAVAREAQGPSEQPTPPEDAADQTGAATPGGPVASPDGQIAPKRFYGTVELDATRPIRSLEQIVEAVVAQLQHTSGTKVTLTLDVEAVSASGFSDADVGVVRDNARQLKFDPSSTGFE
ncbi:DUF499 domain-containing protein [Sphingomonas sp. RB56-2]|uniref:DUF499 domain-containing protein n=1 Tax=Sphingomonas brevis TaxID=2908206 RepID=A0ABT0SBP3_9SPHN|nr:DUF499 domain-containing protein [Sphingomonas brevis]